MTAGELAAATALRRETIAPEPTKLVKVGELVKADRGYKALLDDATARRGELRVAPAVPGRRQKSPAAAALGRELDAGLRTRV